MICENCGTLNEDSAQWCAGCGVTLQATASEQTPVAPTPKKARKRLVFMIGGAVLSAALALLLIFGIRTPESTVNKALEAVENGDAKAIMRLLPKQVKKELERQLQDNEDLIMPDLQEYLQIKLDKILRENNIDLQILEEPEDFRQEVVEFYKDEYRDSYGVEIDSIKDCQIVVDCPTSDGLLHGTIMVLRVVKINGNWYIDFRSLEHLLEVLNPDAYDPGCCV